MPDEQYTREQIRQAWESLRSGERHMEAMEANQPVYSGIPAPPEVEQAIAVLVRARMLTSKQVMDMLAFMPCAPRGPDGKPLGIEYWVAPVEFSEPLSPKMIDVLSHILREHGYYVS